MATPGGRRQGRGIREGELRGGRVLLVDENPLWLQSLRGLLDSDGHRTRSCSATGEALAEVQGGEIDVVLVGLHLGAALDLLGDVKRECPDVEVVMTTGSASIEGAVACMRGGAFDYLANPLGDSQRLRDSVCGAMEERRRRDRNARARVALPSAEARFGMVGASPGMRRLLRTVEALGDNESHVLLRGESGTGKELVARAIHAVSPRRRAHFAPVDCGSLPEGIVESELFGHERGAFTGALGAPGLLRGAHGGTLFLDEIGELPLSTQSKLLRALQEKQIRPLGAARSRAVDVRVIAATHRDLEAMVAEGSFRADLFYRLDVVRIEIPTLRERREDIPPLVEHFLSKHAGRRKGVRGIEPAALELLAQADWPGNVRELENVIESALALAPGPEIRLVDLPRVRRPPALSHAQRAIPLSLVAYERSALERALAETGGHASEAARRLGVARSTLYRKLSRHGLSPRVARSDAGGRRGSG